MLPQRTSTYQEAGLPNITARLSSVYMPGETTSNGSFTVGNNEPSSYVGTRSGGKKRVSFDASRSNPIYGNSTTVQPSALTVNYFIRAK